MWYEHVYDVVRMCMLDFASVFTSLLSDLEIDLEFTDILFVLVREQIRSKPSTLLMLVAQCDRLVIA